MKTLHHMIDRTLKYVLGETRFKTLGAGRTDAMVSANEAAFELFIYDTPIADFKEFIDLFNLNLPQDIKALSIIEVDKNFNVIQDSKIKEYHYVFSFGQKNHPFCAPIMTNIQEDLNIGLMMEAAQLFKGSHNFKAYCYKSNDDSIHNRTVDSSEITMNQDYRANFFPETSYVLKVRGKGFGRNQIRLMMGALIRVGNGELTSKHIQSSLETGELDKINFIAPASGLILHSIAFE
ncbi:tRNA pseudouridine synthase A [Winogradskyella aurantiaca]|uniref:tRNA pseudouridine synthase A n=1 Tax=Winogradskyella aurantiaca TaxID=2219558 RepID=UPI0029371DFE|nr:tRNA pseudouridine synthase A [Winogradskyella aurantiaca]